MHFLGLADFGRGVTHKQLLSRLSPDGGRVVNKRDILMSKGITGDFLGPPELWPVCITKKCRKFSVDTALLKLPLHLGHFPCKAGTFLLQQYTSEKKISLMYKGDFPRYIMLHILLSLIWRGMNLHRLA